MRVITPGDKRRQTASGLVGVYEKRRGFRSKRRDNGSDCTWWLTREEVIYIIIYNKRRGYQRSGYDNKRREGTSNESDCTWVVLLPRNVFFMEDPVALMAAFQ